MNIEFCCEICDADLDGHFKKNGKYDITVEISPCPNCVRLPDDINEGDF